MVISSLTGTLNCTGATVGASGQFGSSLAPADAMIFGFGLLIAIDPINLVDSGSFGFGFAGELIVPAVSLWA